MWLRQLRQGKIKLIDWCCQHKIGQFGPIYQGELLAQAFEDSQRGTYKNIQLHKLCDTINIHMQRQTTGIPYLLKDKQCISLQQITRPRMGKIKVNSGDES